MAKWKLLLTTLPIVLGLLAVRLALRHFAGFHGIVDFGDVGLVFTAGVFLVGFMVAGTMSDYKEAEKLPAEVACTLETIEETVVAAARAKSGLDERRMRGVVLDTCDRIYDGLLGRAPQPAVFAAVGRLHDLSPALDRAGAAQMATRLLVEIHALRRLVTRIAVISRTGFLDIGYALLEALIVLVFVLLLVARFKSPLAESLLVPFVGLVYVYMYRLIRDIDDPFEYDANGQKTGSAEVELFPITEYRERLAARVGSDAPAEGRAAVG